MSTSASEMSVDSSNPCCAPLIVKCKKLEEKRRMFLGAIKTLDVNIQSLQQEKLDLLKACEEEKKRASDYEGRAKDLEERVKDLEERSNELEEEREKEASLRTSLENEIAVLKSVRVSNEPEVAVNNEDLEKEAALLRACVSEKDLEIGRLKKLLAEEKTRADSEKGVADMERKKAAELQSAVRHEKSRADEASKRADAAGRKAEEDNALLESLRNEVQIMSQKLDEANRMVEAEKQSVAKEKSHADEILSRKLEEVNRMLEAEKQRVDKEKRHAKEEKARATESRKLAEANEKRVSDERCRANNLLISLGEERKTVEKLRKELEDVKSCERSALAAQLDELCKNLEVEKSRVDMEKKRADLEMSLKEEQKRSAEAHIKRAMEERCRADELSKNLQSSERRVENLEQELNKMNDILDAERKALEKEKTIVETLELKSEEHERISLENEKKAFEEKCRADNLAQELESTRQMLKDLENELCDVKKSKGLEGLTIVTPDLVRDGHIAKINLLHEQLKFEKKRVKHFKEVAKLEKERNSISQQELHRLRQDFQSVLQHLDMLSDTFGARNHVNKKPRLSNVQCLELPGKMVGCEADLRMSSLSSRDTSCHLKPCAGVAHAGNRVESPSASFSDEQLMGSQERATGSLTTSAGMANESSKQRAIIPIRNDGERVDIFAEDSISPVEFDAGRATKRRKIVDEFESIKCMHAEGKRIFQEAATKLFALHDTLVQPMVEQMEIEKENLELTGKEANTCGNPDLSGQERKAAHELEVAVQRVDDCTMQIEIDKVKSLAPTATRAMVNSEPPEAAGVEKAVSVEEALLRFEEEMGGDFMKLLDLDDAVAEEHFRKAMESPLSPNIPVLDEIDYQRLSVPISASNHADNSYGCWADGSSQNCCIVFSDVVDSGSVARIFLATRTCISRFCPSFQAKWLMEDILGALLPEKDLRPREKVCVLFSLLLLNFCGVCRGKFMDLQSRELLDSFSTHIQSVLLDAKARDLFANTCDLGDLLGLSEDFVLHRKILSENSLISDSLGCGVSSFEILLEGQNSVLLAQMASTDLIVAGSIILASVSAALGFIGSVCEASLKVLSMCRSDHSLVLTILHTFAYVCGEEYFTISKYCSVMKIVKFLVTTIEGSLVNNGNLSVQPGSGCRLDFSPCDNSCPFFGGSVSVHDVSSELLGVLQRLAVSLNASESAQSYNVESLCCCLGVVTSTLELITAKMSWDWLWSKILPELFKMLEACDDIFLVALVVLLGDLGRVGVEAVGHDDAGVKNIVQRLLGILHQISASAHDTLLVAVVHALVGLHPRGPQVLLKSNKVLLAKSGNSAFDPSGIAREILSALNNEETCSLHVS